MRIVASISTPVAFEALWFLSDEVIQVRMAVHAVNQAMETLERVEYPVWEGPRVHAFLRPN